MLTRSHNPMFAAVFVLAFMSFLTGCDAVRSNPDTTLSALERFQIDIAEQEKLIADNGDGTHVPLVRVVAEDDGRPVPNAFVGLTLIGPDGGDGGFQLFLTDGDGIAYRWHRMSPGRYQPHIRPKPGTGHTHTQWRRGEPYVVIRDDGSTDVPELILHKDG